MSFIYAQFSCRKAKPASNDNVQGDPMPGIDPRFTVSRDGRVFKGSRLLKGEIHSKGYRRVRLRSGGKDKNYYVHALVAATFIGPRPAGWHVDHINFDRSDNRVENLRYLPAKENSCRWNKVTEAEG